MLILNNIKNQKLNMILTAFIFTTFTFSTVHASNDELINETNITTSKHRVKSLSSVQFLFNNMVLQHANDRHKTRGSIKHTKLNTRNISAFKQVSQVNINTRGELAHTSI